MLPVTSLQAEPVRKVRPRPAAGQQAPAPKPSPAPEPLPPEPHGKGPVPIGSVSAWFPSESYPPEARAAGQSGRTIFSLEIDRNGRVTGCNIVESSGSELLDTTTCSQAILYGRFEPARDASGKAVPGRWQSAMRWKLAEGGDE